MLYERILKLKQDAAHISINAALNAFDMDECKRLDELAPEHHFIKKKVDQCLDQLKGLSFQYDAKYRTAYEAYSEAVTYVELLDEGIEVTPIKEAKKKKTPDLRINKILDWCKYDLFLEVKALSFVDGNLNYRAAEESGFNMQIELEEQRKKRKGFSSAIAVVSPFLKNGKDPTTTELIEIYIDKINNNIKEGQYDHGDTVLLVDIKQLLVNSSWQQSAIAFYQERNMKSIASGILWHAAFGREGAMIYKPIEIEGKPSFDGILERNGILVDHHYIMGLVFATYENFTNRKYVGFFRDAEQEEGAACFISTFCDFFNDDLNTHAFEVLQGGG